MRIIYKVWRASAWPVLAIAGLILAGCLPDEPPSLGDGVVLLDIPAEEGSGRPRLFRSLEGEVLLSWTEPAGVGRHRLRYAALRGEAWSTPATVVEGTDWFINWADFPSIQRTPAGRLVAHFLRKSAEATFAYDVMVLWSDDDGKTWTEPEAPHDDGTPTEHGFVSMVPFADGRTGLFWLDGRKTGYGETGGQEEAGGHEGHSGEMTLRYAELDAAGDFVADVEVDDRACDCCQTAAVPVPGGVAVFFRDRSETEIRDISVARRIDGVWEAPKTVWPDGWEITGCPVNGPAADAAGERVVLAWFTAARGRSAVRVAFSDDGAASFHPPVTISLDNPLGRVDVALIDGDAVVTWVEQDGDETWIRMQRVYANGGLGRIRSIAQTVPDRASGFPRFVLARPDTLVVAWTHVEGRQTRLRTARVSL